MAVSTLPFAVWVYFECGFCDLPEFLGFLWGWYNIHFWTVCGFIGAGLYFGLRCVFRGLGFGWFAPSTGCSFVGWVWVCLLVCCLGGFLLVANVLTFEVGGA